MNRFAVSKLFFIIGVTGLALVGLLFVLSSPSQAQMSQASQALAPAATPDLLVYKVLNAGVPLAGSQIEYRIAFFNQGNASAQNVLITDTLPGGTSFVSWYGYASNPTVNLTQTITPTMVGNRVVWNLGTVPAGQYGNIYTKIQITDTAQVGNVLTNVVQIMSTDTEITYTNNTYTHTIAVVAPTVDMSIYKGVSGTPLPGNQIQYLISYSNLGNSPAHDVEITDTLPVSVAYVTHSAPGFTTVFTGSTLVVTQALVNAGTSGVITLTVHITDTAQPGQVLTNVVQVSTSDVDITPTNNIFTRTTAIVTPTADMSIYKWVSGTPLPGNQIQYLISYNNVGTAPAHDVAITDTLPASVAYVTHSAPGFTTVITGNMLVVTQALVNAGTGGTITLTVHLTDTAQAGQVLTNVVQVSTSDVDGNPANNTFTRTTTIVTPTVDMSVYKGVSGTPLPGNQIQYLINYSNLGNSPAHNIRITDTLPAGVVYVTHTAPGFATVITGSTVVVTQALVNAGASGTIYVTVRVADTAQAGQVLTNVVKVSTSDVDSNLANNTFTRTTAVVTPTVDMSIYTWTPNAPLPGSQIYYQINYSNLGNSPAHNVRITDTLPVSVTYLGHSASGFTTVITGSTLVVTQALINAGASGTIYVSVRITNTAQPGQLLTNIVQVSTSDVDINPANNTYMRTTIIAAPPITSTINPSGGSFVVYTDTHGLTNTLDVPTNAVSGTVDLQYTALFTPVAAISPELQLAGNAFELDAYSNNTYVNGFTFSKTVTLTVQYEPSDLYGVETNTLALYRWVSPGWQIVGARPGEGQTLDTDHHQLIVHLNGLSQFATLGNSHKIYLPMILAGG